MNMKLWLLPIYPYQGTASCTSALGVDSGVDCIKNRHCKERDIPVGVRRKTYTIHNHHQEICGGCRLRA